VKRVVVTSSFAAIGYGHPQQDKPFNEETWTNLASGDVPPYQKSKTIAERAAWDFVKGEDGKGLELAVINPVGIFGPVLGKDFATSIIIVQRLLNGDLPGCPQISFGIVDVRDVASLHLLAMTHEKAAGERFIAISPPSMTIQEMALVLKKRLPELAKKAPTRVLPNLLLRIVGLFDKEVAFIIGELVKKDATNEKAKRILGWSPRSPEDALVASAESLVKFGLLKK
jgi:dihydroflavonol-4-reductase